MKPVYLILGLLAGYLLRPLLFGLAVALERMATAFPGIEIKRLE